MLHEIATPIILRRIDEEKKKLRAKKHVLVAHISSDQAFMSETAAVENEDVFLNGQMDDPLSVVIDIVGSDRAALQSIDEELAKLEKSEAFTRRTLAPVSN